MTRARWAALGAAVAVTLGAGGGVFHIAQATVSSGPRAVFVDVNPTRVLDTRGAGVGLSGTFTSGTGRQLKVTGIIPTTTGTKQVVPEGATGVVLNVTAVNPSHNGFVSVRPGNAVGVPATSNLNVVAQQTMPNAVTVAVTTTGPGAGSINLWYQSLVAGATTNLLVDVVGYYNDHNHDDRYYTKTQTDSAISSAVSTAIEANPGFDPANIVWVAKSGGDFTTVTAAMNSITDASATNPYVVRVAPGVYSERVVLKNHVQLEGSGQDATSIVAPPVEGGVVDLGTVYVGPSTTTRIRHLTITTTSGAGAGAALMLHDLTGPVHISDVTLQPRGVGAYGIFQFAVANPDNRLVTGDRIVINTVGVSEAFGVYLINAAPTFTDLKVEASTVDGEGTQSVAVFTFGKNVSGFSPTIARADLTASAAFAAPVIFADGSDILVRDSKLIAFGHPIVTVEGGAQPKLVNNQMQGSVPAGVTCLNNYTLGATPLNCPT